MYHDIWNQHSENRFEKFEFGEYDADKIKTNILFAINSLKLVELTSHKNLSSIQAVEKNLIIFCVTIDGNVNEECLV